jgi:hypothetical protein
VLTEDDGNSQMGPPFKKRCILPFSADNRYPTQWLKELAGLTLVFDMTPDDDHSEEEGYYTYPDLKASKATW